MCDRGMSASGRRTAAYNSSAARHHRTVAVDGAVAVPIAAATMSVPGATRALSAASIARVPRTAGRQTDQITFIAQNRHPPHS
jgi:hypothetical protein